MVESEVRRIKQKTARHKERKRESETGRRGKRTALEVTRERKGAKFE